MKRDCFILGSLKCVAYLVFLFCMFSCEAFRGGKSLPVPEAWASHKIHFAERDWYARHSDVLVAAGPNRWSSTSDSLSVNDQDQLTMRIINRDYRWYASEISTPWPFEHGAMQALLEGPLGELDANVIFGFFLYKNDHSELDIELGTWGKFSDYNAQFVVAPPIEASRLHRFALPEECHKAMTSICFGSRYFVFRWQCEGGAITTWRHATTFVPEPRQHHVHLNLWMFKTRPPQQRKSVAIKIHEVRFIPTDSCTN